MKGEGYMLYLGHFSFAQERVETDSVTEHHGYFTTVVEADNVEAAMGKFEILLHALRSEGDLFDDVDEVFLDVCVECRVIPTEGFLAHFKKWSGGKTSSISTGVRGAAEEQVTAYSLSYGDDPDNGDGGLVKPFVTF